MIDAYIIDRLREHREKTPRREATLRLPVPPGDPRTPPPSATEEPPEEAQRGVAIIDFSI